MEPELKNTKDNLKKANKEIKEKNETIEQMQLDIDALKKKQAEILEGHVCYYVPCLEESIDRHSFCVKDVVGRIPVDYSDVLEHQSGKGLEMDLFEQNVAFYLV